MDEEKFQLLAGSPEPEQSSSSLPKKGGRRVGMMIALGVLLFFGLKVWGGESDRTSSAPVILQQSTGEAEESVPSTIDEVASHLAIEEELFAEQLSIVLQSQRCAMTHAVYASADRSSMDREQALVKSLELQREMLVEEARGLSSLAPQSDEVFALTSHLQNIAATLEAIRAANRGENQVPNCEVDLVPLIFKVNALVEAAVLHHAAKQQAVQEVLGQ